MIGFVLLRKIFKVNFEKKMLALNLAEKSETLHDFDGFLTVSRPKISGKRHVIGFIQLRNGH